MDIVKSADQTIILERYSIEREASGQPVTIRAELQLLSTAMVPATIRLRVKYQDNDIPHRSERELGQRILQLLRNRLDY